MQALFGYLGALRRVQGLTNRFSFNDEQELPALLAQGRRFQGNILRVNHSVYPQKGFSTKLERGIFYVSSTLVVKEVIEDKIFLIHGHKVMVDRDLAQLYGVPTKVLNQAVKRNKRRFPTDFMFPLTKEKTEQLVTNCDRFRTLKHSSVPPDVFTEQGVAMLSTVLNSERAIRVNIEIMRTFVRLRKILSTHKELARKLEELERKYDVQFRAVFDAIRHLMCKEQKPKQKIGFRP